MAGTEIEIRMENDARINSTTNEFIHAATRTVRHRHGIREAHFITGCQPANKKQYATENKFN